MRPTIRNFGLMSAIMIVAISPSLARDDGVNYTGAGQRSSMDCGGRGAYIEGASNEFTITGECTYLKLRGAGNIIHISMAAGSVIDVEGASNHIYWTAPGKSRPRQKIVGAGNQVTRDR